MVTGSSGDTILNCLGELGEIRERAGIAADGQPAGTPGTGGVERLLPRENGQRLVGGEREEEELFDLSAGITWFGDIIT